MKKIGYFLLFTALVLIDRVSKYWVLNNNISYNNGFFFGIHLSFNRGISWGLFHSENSTMFTLVSAVIACTLICFFYFTFCMHRENRSIIASLFICAGAVSNFVDRLWYKAVVDFILFYWKETAFPIFNVADTWIVCGVFYILLFQYRDLCKISVKK